ncbi:MAG: hypothetical protein EXR21_03875 [Flavobacteriaceae bacterium]|nr:hypothetical protein [Flavobacteriaceae bacterium]
MRLSFKLVILYFHLLAFRGQAQLDSARLDSLQSLEFHIQGQAMVMLNDKDERARISSTYFMVKNLVAAFKIKGSYYYPFDSVKSLSILYPEDKTFRIITWHLVLNDGTNRQYGVIQMNPDFFNLKKQQPKLYYPLIDRSDSVSDPLHTVCDAEKWWGGHYYKIITTKVKKKKYYTLLGMDGYSMMGNRKVIDVLWFDAEGIPHFGALIFDNNTPQRKVEKTIVEGYHPEVLIHEEKNTEKENREKRVIFLYDNDATMTMRYLSEEKTIIFDNLIPKDGKSFELKHMYVPDGTFDYYVWEKDRWKLHRFYNADKTPTIGEPGKAN